MERLDQIVARVLAGLSDTIEEKEAGGAKASGQLARGNKGRNKSPHGRDLDPQAFHRSFRSEALPRFKGRPGRRW